MFPLEILPPGEETASLLQASLTDVCSMLSLITAGLVFCHLLLESVG